MSPKRVAIIGAGPSGLPSIKAFRELGFEVTCFERGVGVGGNWRFNDEIGHSSVFETTHIISSKFASQYADHPLPKDAPDYPSHQDLLAYFESYAERFDLLPSIQFQTEVTRAQPTEGGGWRVVSKSKEGSETEAVFDALVVASGHHHIPRWPDYSGTFSGDYLHSHDFKRAAPFAGKRVLVIGGGNSACDVAVETARVSAKTAISWRRGYYLIPKFLFGVPADVFFHRFRHSPVRMQAATLKLILRVLQGRNGAIGLPDPDHPPGATHPTVNSELYHAIRHGKVAPRGDVERFEGRVVHFKDGTAEEFDAVVACTGFQISHPFFDRALFDFSKGPLPLFHKMIPAEQRNIYFVGLFQPLGCIWPGAELQAKLAAKHLAGLWKPDGDLKGLIAREMANPDLQQLDTPRHTMTVNGSKFLARLQKDLDRSRKAPFAAE